MMLVSKRCICRSLALDEISTTYCRARDREHACCCREIFEKLFVNRRAAGICSASVHRCICDKMSRKICSATEHPYKLPYKVYCCIVS